MFVHSLFIFPSNLGMRLKPERKGILDAISQILKFNLAKGKAVILVIDGKRTETLKQPQRWTKIYPNKVEFPKGHIESGVLVLFPKSYLHSKRKSRLGPELSVQKLTRKIEEIKKNKKYQTIATSGNGILMITRVCDCSLEQLGFEPSIVSFGRQPVTSKKLGLTEVICCYDFEAIQRMSVHNLIQLIKYHDMMLDWSNPLKSTTWNSHRIVNCISRGIDKVMGRGSDKLIFRTLKVIYFIDKEHIVTNPDIFEAKIARILGSSARTVLDSIAYELRTELMPKEGHLKLVFDV